MTSYRLHNQFAGHFHWQKGSVHMDVERVPPWFH